MLLQRFPLSYYYARHLVTIQHRVHLSSLVIEASSSEALRKYLVERKKGPQEKLRRNSSAVFFPQLLIFFTLSDRRKNESGKPRGVTMPTIWT